ncbi:MAG: 50S ribosomal protein L24 [Spirochaetes bacterium]|nr:50S ribosomal protein L24 [Spirochaetota bacterium]
MVATADKIKLKKDDVVEVIAGRDAGRSGDRKRGKILKILREKNRVVVEGVNIVKKTKKRRSQQDRGGIIEVEAGIHISNVMIVCKKCGPSRIGYKVEDKKAAPSGQAAKGYTPKKTRICKKCGEAF